jgi:hypothetical protein
MGKRVNELNPLPHSLFQPYNEAPESCILYPES